MNRIFILLTLTIIITITACGQSQPDKVKNPEKNISNWTSLKNDKYSITYPSNWDLDESGQMGTSFVLMSPLSNELDNFRENVNLLIQDLSKYNLNLDQYVEISENQVKTLITDGKILLSERKKNNNIEYQKIIYTGKQGIFDLKFEQYYWVINDKAYILTLTCKIDDFEIFIKTGEKILNSFELK